MFARFFLNYLKILCISIRPLSFWFITSCGNEAEPTKLAVSSASLEAPDISVLFPLQLPADSSSRIFPSDGTGLCNLLSLSGESHNFLSKELFDRFRNRNFGNPCPGNVDFKPVDQLLNQQTHLSLAVGLNPAVCEYDHWKVVSFRFDPCLGRDPAESCGDAALRLVAQPFLETSAGTLAIDASLHLIFEPRELRDVIANLEENARLRKTIESHARRSGSAERDPYFLVPHPGLVEEMNNCQGPMKRQLLSSFSRLMSQSQLGEIAWMTSSSSVTNWTFGSDMIVNGDLPKTEPARHSNFSMDAFEKTGFPFNEEAVTQMKKGVLHLASSFLDGAFDPVRNSPPSSRSLEDLAKAQSPRLLSQAERADCITCHAADQVAQYWQDQFGANPTIAMDPEDSKVFSEFQQSRRSMQNFRSFGYWKGFDFGVSKRVILETHQDLRALRRED